MFNTFVNIGVIQLSFKKEVCHPIAKPYKELCHKIYQNSNKGDCHQID